MRRLLGNELMVRQDWLGILLIKKFVLEKKELCSEKKGIPTVYMQKALNCACRSEICSFRIR